MFSSGWEGCGSLSCHSSLLTFLCLLFMIRDHVHACAHTRTHTQVCTSRSMYHTKRCIHALTHTLTHMCTNICTHAHSCIHTVSHTCSHTRPHMFAHITQLYSYNLTLIHTFAHSQRRCTIVSGTLTQVRTGFIFSTYRSSKFALVQGNPTLSRVKAKGKTQTCVSDINSLSTLG